MTVQQLIDEINVLIADGTLNRTESVVIHKDGMNQSVRRLILLRGDGLLLETY